MENQVSSNTVGISKRDLLIFFFKWKGTIFGWALFTFCLVTALTYLLPQLYVAEAKIVIERNKSPNLRSTLSFDGMESIEVMNNEIAIIKSYPVMTAVVDQAAPHKRPSSEGAVKEFIENTKNTLANMGLITNLGKRDRWITGLINWVEAKPVVNSNVLEISYSDEEPEWAAKIVNAVLDQYINQHIAVYSSKGVTEFYESQLQAAKEKLEQLRQEDRDFKQSGAISAVGARQSALVGELTALREELAEARVARAKLLTRYQNGHNEVKIETNRIASLSANLDKIQQQLGMLEEQQGTIAARDVLIKSQEAIVVELQREYEEARLNAATNANVINVLPVEYATVPAKPKFARLLLIFLSIILGFMLSISIAILREYMDHRADNPDVSEAALGVPCVGSIPRVRNFRWRASR